jgi:MraZ protein
VEKGGKGIVAKMNNFFFSGSATAKLDEKNRFVLPQSMRYGLVENGKLEFVVGLGLGGCLAIYKTSDIQKIVEKFKEKQHIAKFQKFFTLFFSTLHHTSCDKIGRMNLPAHLKKAAGIEKEVVVAGVMDKIEIWPKDKYEDKLAELFNSKEEINEITEEAFAALSESKESDNDN